MPLANDNFARAVILAPIYETAPLEGIARKIAIDMVERVEPLRGDDLIDLITMHLTAFNMSRAAICRDEWHKIVAERNLTPGSAAEKFAARILDRINLIDEKTVMPSMIPSLDSAPNADWRERINDMPLVQPSGPAYVTTYRLDMLEKRVEALEAKEAARVHPADRMAAKLPKQWVTTYGLPMNKFCLILVNEDPHKSERIARDCEFDTRAAAASFGKDWAHKNGFEFRD